MPLKSVPLEEKLNVFDDDRDGFQLDHIGLILFLLLFSHLEYFKLLIN